MNARMKVLATVGCALLVVGVGAGVPLRPQQLSATCQAAEDHYNATYAGDDHETTKKNEFGPCSEATYDEWAVIRDRFHMDGKVPVFEGSPGDSIDCNPEQVQGWFDDAWNTMTVLQVTGIDRHYQNGTIDYLLGFHAPDHTYLAYQPGSSETQDLIAFHEVYHHAREGETEEEVDHYDDLYIANCYSETPPPPEDDDDNGTDPPPVDDPGNGGETCTEVWVVDLTYYACVGTVDLNDAPCFDTDGDGVYECSELVAGLECELVEVGHYGSNASPIHR